MFLATTNEAESSANTLGGGERVMDCSGGKDVGDIGNNSGTMQFNGVSVACIL